MCAAVDASVIKRTQEELGKYVKKPPLTEKLLNKPPFRFLHDVVNVIVTETGFLAGLFTDEELSSQNIKDKEAKVAFLQKCIDATSLATGENYTVRPTKIVAGHDVDKTNEWLQGLGRAITKKVDSTEAVQQILSGVKPEKAAKKPDKEKEKSEKKDRSKKESSSRKEKSSSSKDKDEKRRSSRSKKDEKEDKDRRKSKSGDRSPEKPKASKSRASSRIGQVKDSGKENSPPHEKIEENSMIPNGDATVEEIDSARGSLKSAQRPPSARPADTVGPAADIDEAIDEGIDTQDVNGEAIDHLDSNTLTGDAGGEGVRTAAGNMEEGMEVGGPESLMQVEGDMQEKQDQNEADTEGQNQMLSLVNENNNNIDPAILKAMAPESNGEEDQLGLPSAPEPPDSGVGSLESPKNRPLQSEEEPAPAPAAPPSAKAGPQPLRALEQFGDETSAVPSLVSQIPVAQKEEQPSFPTREKSARPRTGRRSARPPSARPAPPRVRERREIPKEELPRPATGKPVANVIMTGSLDGNDDDDDNFMVEESKPALQEDLLGADSLVGDTTVATAAAAVGEDGEGAGLLVAQILETKKELEDGRRNAFSPETPGHRRVQIEQSELSDANRRKEREVIQKDVQKLSGSIQSITRSVNPLAKMLDYLQEDLDSMQKELETWRDENKQLAQTLKREQSTTEQALEPLRSQLGELESAVQEQRDKLSAVKSNILRNNEKISRLMAGINLNM